MVGRAPAAVLGLAVLAGSLVAGCATRAPRTSRQLAPLRDEGEVYVYLEPLPPDARRVAFSFASAAAWTPAGEVPLELLRSEVSGSDPARQRLIAFGRLPPGRYEGIRLGVARAVLRTAEGGADLLVPDDLGRVQARFTVEARRATVFALSLEPRRPDEGEFALAARALVARVGTPPTPQLAGYCSVPDHDAIVLFDKRSRRVAAVLPIGGRPTGFALDVSGERLFTASERDGRVDVTDTTSLLPIARVTLRPDDGPTWLALAQRGGVLLVLDRDSSAVSFVDTAAAAEVARVAVDEEPSALVMDRAGTRAIVLSARTNTITVLDVPTRSVVRHLTTEPEPVWAAVDRAGRNLYVVHRGSVYMAVYALADLSLQKRVYVGAAASFVLVDTRTDLVYVALADEPRVQVFDPLSLVPLATVELSAPATQMVVDDAENTLLVLMPLIPAVGAVDLTSRSELGGFELPAEPVDVTAAGGRH